MESWSTNVHKIINTVEFKQVDTRMAVFGSVSLSCGEEGGKPMYFVAQSVQEYSFRWEETRELHEFIKSIDIQFQTPTSELSRSGKEYIPSFSSNVGILQATGSSEEDKQE